MNKSDLVTKLMKKEHLSEKQAARIVNLIFDTIAEGSKSSAPDPPLKEVLKATDSEHDDFNFRCMIDECFNHECIFCTSSDEHYLMENNYAFALSDKYPITEGHTLIIPKRHFAYYFDSIKVEHDAIYDLLKAGENSWWRVTPRLKGSTLV